MTSVANMASNMSESLNPATTTQSSLGKWYAAASGIQALATIGQGVAQNQAASSEASSLQHQSDLAMQNANFEAAAKAREVKNFAADQTMEYAASGVTLAGSPAQVIAQTRQLGQQEVDLITKRGQYSTQLLRTQAMRTKASGRQALLGSFTGAALGGLQNYMRGSRIFGSNSGLARGSLGHANPFGLDPAEPDINPSIF